MAKIGGSGDATSILGFKAFGLDVFACNTAEEAAAKLHQIAKEGIWDYLHHGAVLSGAAGGDGPVCQ